MANKNHILQISFRELDDLLFFAKNAMPEGTTVYHADALDPEANGRAMKNTYVVRKTGDKSDEFKA